MLFRDVLFALAFRELRADPEQIEGAACIAVFLRREGGDQMEDAFRGRAVLEREARPLREDVVQFVRVVRGEDHLLVRQARADAWVEVLREGQLVRDADQGDAGLGQVVVDLQELIQDLVCRLLLEKKKKRRREESRLGRGAVSRAKRPPHLAGPNPATQERTTSSA